MAHNDLLTDKLQPGLLECLRCVAGVLECFFKCLGLCDQLGIKWRRHDEPAFFRSFERDDEVAITDGVLLIAQGFSP